MANMRDLLSDIEEMSVYHNELIDFDELVTKLNCNKQSLKIIHQNIRSIYKNFDSFQVLLADLKVDCDILIFTETWTDHNKPIPHYDGYNLAFSNNCRNQNDGVVVYTRENIDCYIEEPDFEDANCLIIKIANDSIIIAIYRSPSCSNIDVFLNNLDFILQKYKTYKNIGIVGDINIDIKAYIEDHRKEREKILKKGNYLNLIAEHGLIPAHTFPTREASCLDHVVLKGYASSQTFVFQTAFTDHQPILLDLNTKPIYKNKSLTFKKIDYNNALKQIENTDFSYIYLIKDPNEATDSVLSILRTVLTDHTKVSTIPRRKRVLKPWITEGVLRCMRNRNKLQKVAQSNPTDELAQITHRRYRNFYYNLGKKLKHLYYKSEIEKCSNLKQTWKTIKSVNNSNRCNTECLSTDLLKLNPKGPIDSVNDVNAYFSTIGQKLAQKIPQISSGPSYFKSKNHLKSFVMLDVDDQEVGDIVKNMKTDSATGWDGIPSRFLKLSCRFIAPVLTYIFNLCLSSGVFPNSFKKAIITPVFKQGNRDDINNYRPISVLPALSKVFEKLLNKRLIKYLENENLLAQSQFGFRAGKSTEDAVRDLTESIVGNLDKRKKCVGIFLDLAKAFDTVSIPILLNKMEGMGIRGVPLGIFESYLTNRYQRVKIGEFISSEMPIAYGTPQGSVIGPSLFLIYINELCLHTPKNGKVFTFADDTALVYYGDTWNEVRNYAEQGLNAVISWLNKNLLSLNVGKTKYVTFSINNCTQPDVKFGIRAHTCKNSPSQQCSCNFLVRTTHIRYLGVEVDSHLTWARHIENINGKVRKIIWVMKNLRHVADIHLLKIVYYALCQSILSYCIEVWGGACKTRLLSIERAQRSVLKVMMQKPFRFSTSELYKKCGVLTVRQLFILKTVLKHHTKLTYDPTKLNNENRRRPKDICKMEKCNTTFYRRFPSFLGPHLYNKMNKTIDIYKLPKTQCKTKILNWLQYLNYNETENLLI
jgi:hypothetical protein